MKTARLEIRIKRKDKELLVKRAKNAEIMLSEYVRDKCLLNKELSKKEKEKMMHILVQTRRIGNNLNQLLKLIYTKEIKDIKNGEIIEDIKIIKENQKYLLELMDKINGR